jgi:hypothetical protein
LDKAEHHKDQESRSLIAPREQRTLWPPKAWHQRESERRCHQYANFIENDVQGGETFALPPFFTLSGISFVFRAS